MIQQVAPLKRAEPQYKIPLRRSELEQLGKLAVIFGQIDHLMAGIISHLLCLDFFAGHLFMERMTSGVKLGYLKKSLERIKDDEIRKIADAFHEDMSGLVERRNHIFHGMWGWEIRDGKSKPGCCYVTNKPQPTIYPEKLAVYVERAALQSRRIDMVYRHLMGAPPLEAGNPNPKYFFGNDLNIEALGARGIQTEEIGRSYKGPRDPG